MRLVIKLVHLVRCNASAKLHVLQFQIACERFQFRPLAAVTRDDQARLGKFCWIFANARKIHATLYSGYRLRFDKNIGRSGLRSLNLNRLGSMMFDTAEARKPNFQKTSTRYCDGTISSSANLMIGTDVRRPAAKMIFSFATAIVQHSFLTEGSRDDDRRRRRQ